ncbi:unnamed protein product [Arabidopsis halleri]
MPSNTTALDAVGCVSAGLVPLVQRDPMASQEVHLQLLQERGGMATNSRSSFQAEKSNGECVTTTQAQQKVRGRRRILSKEEEKMRGGRILSKEKEKKRDSYLFCCQNFYTLPEMIKYMKENHGVGESTVKNVFRELLKGRKAEAYLRESQKRMKTKTTTTT